MYLKWVHTLEKYSTLLQFWTSRLSRLEAVRSQLTSMVVLNVLHNLDQAHSTYAQAFQHVHHDIGRAIVDAELCLMYLSALRPWCLKLEEAYSPETITCLFPPLMMTLLLIWQHSGCVHREGEREERREGGREHTFSWNIFLDCDSSACSQTVPPPSLSFLLPTSLTTSSFLLPFLSLSLHPSLSLLSSCTLGFAWSWLITCCRLDLLMYSCIH